MRFRDSKGRFKKNIECVVCGEEILNKNDSKVTPSCCTECYKQPHRTWRESIKRQLTTPFVPITKRESYERGH